MVYIFSVSCFSQQTVTFGDNGKEWLVETYFPPPPEGAIPGEDDTIIPTFYYSRTAPTYSASFTSPVINVLGKYNGISFVRPPISVKIRGHKKEVIAKRNDEVNRTETEIYFTNDTILTSDAGLLF